MISLIGVVTTADMITIIGRGINLIQKWLDKTQNLDNEIVIYDEPVDDNQHLSKQNDYSVLGDDPFNIIYHSIDATN